MDPPSIFLPQRLSLDGPCYLILRNWNSEPLQKPETTFSFSSKQLGNRKQTFRWYSKTHFVSMHHCFSLCVGKRLQLLRTWGILFLDVCWYFTELPVWGNYLFILKSAIWALLSDTTSCNYHSMISFLTKLQNDLHGEHGKNTSKSVQELLPAAAEARPSHGRKERLSCRGGGGAQVNVHTEGRSFADTSMPPSMSTAPSISLDVCPPSTDYTDSFRGRSWEDMTLKIYLGWRLQYALPTVDCPPYRITTQYGRI